MEKETIYHWAIDETTNTGVRHPGKVWRFTTGGGGAVRGEYFNSMVPQGNPALTRMDSTIDFTWGDAGPGDPIGADRFCARWTADLEIAVADSAGKSATVAHPDPTAVTTTAWTEWSVPLSGFTGVNLSKIKKVYVGVGDRQGSQPDGTGRIYIDDIRVTKP
jgi:hypothetical protein